MIFFREIEMESFLHFMEKRGDEFYKKLKKHGLFRWRVNQIWNKTGGALSSVFEYKDQKPYKKSIEEKKNLKKKMKFFSVKLILKEPQADQLICLISIIYLLCDVKLIL